MLCKICTFIFLYIYMFCIYLCLVNSKKIGFIIKIVSFICCKYSYIFLFVLFPGIMTKSRFLKVYLFVFQYVSYYQMNNKENKTHHTPPNKQHTQPKQDGEGGVHHTAIIWCKHPFQKKN